MLVGLFVGGLVDGQRLLAIGVGAAALFIGVAMLAARRSVPPLAAVLGWPADARRGGRRRHGSRAPTRCATPAAPPRRRPR